MSVVKESTSEAGMGEPVLYSVADGVATITLNRPDRLNAWNRAMAHAFKAAVLGARDDADVRAIVLTGAGRGFCSGADFDLLDEAAGDDDFDGTSGTLLPSALVDVPKPIIAAINGPAAGYGLVLALCCDVRFVAAGAKLTIVFPRIGLIAEYGSAWLLPRLVGTAHALDLLMSGRVILADEAARIGLVSAVLEPEVLMPHATDYARDIAANCSPDAVRTIKRQVYEGFELPLARSVEASLRLMEASLRTDDFKEAMAAMAAKRKPRFSNLK